MYRLKRSLSATFFVVLFSFIFSSSTAQDKKNFSSFEKLKTAFHNPKLDSYFVVAHRGDWKNAPENSIQAIQNCIDMGVDMVEIDIRKTKDGHLVLMHDGTINRTTNGTGRVNTLTLKELKSYFLKDKTGKLTKHRIPTLAEALAVCKSRILINLDKSYKIFKMCYKEVKKQEMLDQVLFKGEASFEAFKAKVGPALDDIYYMPKVNLKRANASKIIDSYLTNYKPIAFAFNVTNTQLDNPAFQRYEELRNKGIHVWMNALWARQNAGHHDDLAIKDPKVYDWYIKNHVNFIQTDNPLLLLNYLRKQKLHD